VPSTPAPPLLLALLLPPVPPAPPPLALPLPPLRRRRRRRQLLSCLLPAPRWQVRDGYKHMQRYLDISIAQMSADFETVRYARTQQN
jgi:hypothetical protein